MKLKLGLVVGFAAGYWYASQSDEERKRQLDDAVAKVRDDPRVHRVTDTMSRKANDLAEAVESRAGGEGAGTDGTDGGASVARDRPGGGAG